MNIEGISEQAAKMYKGTSKEKAAFRKGMIAMYQYMRDSYMIHDTPQVDACLPSIMNYINK